MSDSTLRTIFIDALDQPTAEERARFLDQACGTDTALRQQVETLLRSHEEAAGFLSDPSRKPDGPDIAPRHVNPSLTEKPGDRIGRYKLLQEIGEGGCGLVYMAEQEEPVRRRVALKVIKLGMDTREVMTRFEAERQALALMDHPNIAKVLDAGATETGRPYFVMELIRGVRITDFCDDGRLSTEDRLKLFIQVCQAIQHAHQKGIIHRDIKPSNILVTVNDAEPVPKVIDFGIAKATQGRLTDKTLFTAFEQFIGTPAYMSPEQAVMTSLDIDTRSDIYSLGVLLYELLTGRPPFDQQELLAAGLDEMRRTIREKEPPKPSTRLSSLEQQELTTTARRRQTEAPRLVHLVRGDLDWIVMRCLEKHRSRRYESSIELARDVERHLANEPVTARAPSRWYELQKTVRRHRFAFAAGAAVFLALTLGIIGSAYQAIRATKAEREQVQLRREAEGEKKRAESAAARSEQVAQFMTEMLEGAGPSVARGRDATLLQEILEQTAARIHGLTNQPEVQGDLWTVLGNTYEDIGEHTNSAKMHEEALESYRRAFSGDHPKLAVALGDLGAEQSFLTRIKAGTNHAWMGLEMARRLGDEQTLATCLMRYAYSLNSWGQGTVAAEPYVREALAIRQKFGTNEALMSVLYRLSASVTNAVEAEALTRQCLTYDLEKYGEEHTRVAYRRNVHGQKLLLLDRESEAEVEFREALRLWRKLFQPHHPYRPIVFRYFIQSLALQQKWTQAEGEVEEERSVFPTNDYCPTIVMALSISKGDWSVAPTNLVTPLETRMGTNGTSFNAAIMLARSGRMEPYRRCVDVLLTRAEGQNGANRAEQASKAALLFPSDPKTLAAAGKLADYAVTKNPESPWALSTKALVEYRRGDFSSAIEFADRALTAKDVWASCQATAYCIQALAYGGLRNEVKLRTALTAARRTEVEYRRKIILEHWFLGHYWGHRDWIMADFLRREAEAQANASSKSAQAGN